MFLGTSISYEVWYSPQEPVMGEYFSRKVYDSSSVEDAKQYVGERKSAGTGYLEIIQVTMKREKL